MFTPHNGPKVSGREPLVVCAHQRTGGTLAGAARCRGVTQPWLSGRVVGRVRLPESSLGGEEPIVLKVDPFDAGAAVAPVAAQIGPPADEHAGSHLVLFFQV